MIDVFALQSRVIDLGRLGENQHRRVVFDVSGYIKQYPDATFTVLNQLPGENTSYPVPTVTHDGNNVYWAVTNADLTKTGNGKCELLVMQGEVIAKSVIYLTRVGEALDGSGEVPDQWESWQTVFAGLKDEAVTAAEGAAEYAQSAESAAQAVQDMGATAETMAPGSEATVEKYVDEHGAVTLAFGIPRGDKGDKGDTGEKGDPGPKGDPGDPGDLSGKADVILTSASGNPASFSDGADGAKMTSLVVDMEPVQDLHGYDYPWPAGGGVNLLACPTAQSVTQNGITVSTDGTGVYKITGTATGGATFVFDVSKFTTPASGYMHLMNDVANGSITFSLRDASGTIYGTSFGLLSVNRITALEEQQLGVDVSKLYIYINSSLAGQTLNITMSPMICSTSTATAFSPYSNICPISGWTGLTLNHSGADTSNPDVLSYSWESEAGTVYGGILDVLSGVLTVDRAMVDLGSLTYVYLSQGNNVFYAPLKDAKSNTGTGNLPNLKSSQYKTTTAKSAAAWGITSEDAVISLGYDSARVYIRDSAYTDAATFKAAMSGVQLVYQLATPITYQLEPHEVTTLLGDNNIWADTGDVAATYRADTKRYIDAKIARAIKEAMRE